MFRLRSVVRLETGMLCSSENLHAVICAVESLMKEDGLAIERKAQATLVIQEKMTSFLYNFGSHSASRAHIRLKTAKGRLVLFALLEYRAHEIVLIGLSVVLALLSGFSGLAFLGLLCFHAMTRVHVFSAAKSFESRLRMCVAKLRVEAAKRDLERSQVILDAIRKNIEANGGNDNETSAQRGFSDHHERPSRMEDR